jgi:arylsulfatase A-like enzyme
MLRALLLFLFACCAHAADRPNIVLLMGDDHGWGDVAYNGHPYLKTPVLDEMAATGLRLDRFYSAHSSCSPTRGSVITGRHPNRYGTFAPGFSLRPEEIGIAQLMKQAGYTTAHFGKWHLGPVKATSPTNPGRMGFDTWLSHDNFFELNPVLSRNGGDPVRIDGESSEILIAEAVLFIDKAKTSDTPFFIVIWFGSPHEPYSGLPADLALYDHLPETFATTKVSVTSNETGNATKRLQREVLRERYAEITAMDRSIGQLRSHLNANGQRANTLLWYCGDNGTPPEATATMTLRGCKGQVYEGGLRVPGVVEWPAKIARPRHSALPTVTSDLLPTVCDIAGVALPDRVLDGVSLKPLLEGDMAERSRPIGFWQWDEKRPRESRPYIAADLQSGTTPMTKIMKGKATRDFNNHVHAEITVSDFSGERAWMDGRYKLVLEASARTPRELFDVVADPFEKTNLINDEPDRATAMEAAMRAWQQSVLESLIGRDYPAAR